MEGVTMTYTLMADNLHSSEESWWMGWGEWRHSWKGRVLGVVWRSCLNCEDAVHYIQQPQENPFQSLYKGILILLSSCMIVFPSKHNEPCSRSFYSLLLRNLKPQLQAPPSRIKYCTACNLCSIFISKLSVRPVSTFLLTGLFLV